MSLKTVLLLALPRLRHVYTACSLFGPRRAPGPHHTRHRRHPPSSRSQNPLSLSALSFLSSTSLHESQMQAARPSLLDPSQDLCGQLHGDVALADVAAHEPQFRGKCKSAKGVCVLQRQGSRISDILPTMPVL